MNLQLLIFLLKIKKSSQQTQSNFFRINIFWCFIPLAYNIVDKFRF